MLSHKVEAMIAEFAREVAARPPRQITDHERAFWQRWQENKLRDGRARSISMDGTWLQRARMSHED